MRLIPVIDILNQQVVRGIAGRREEYRPIQSALTPSTNPRDVALAIREQFGFEDLYVADLDAITLQRIDKTLYTDLMSLGYRVWLDSGSGDVDRVLGLTDTGVHRVIVGLESCPNPVIARRIAQQFPVDNLVFSLDLKNGVPLASHHWARTTDLIADQVIEAGFRSLIVLDLAGVGTGGGVPTDRLCWGLRQRYGTDIELITGGGIQSPSDLSPLRSIPVDGVLIASALHVPSTWIRKSTESRTT